MTSRGSKAHGRSSRSAARRPQRDYGCTTSSGSARAKSLRTTPGAAGRFRLHRMAAPSFRAPNTGSRPCGEVASSPYGRTDFQLSARLRAAEERSPAEAVDRAQEGTDRRAPDGTTRVADAERRLEVELLRSSSLATPIRRGRENVSICTCDCDGHRGRRTPDGNVRGVDLAVPRQDGTEGQPHEPAHDAPRHGDE